jgi:hypothetical protein
MFLEAYGEKNGSTFFFYCQKKDPKTPILYPLSWGQVPKILKKNNFFFRQNQVQFSMAFKSTTYSALKKAKSWRLRLYGRIGVLSTFTKEIGNSKVGTLKPDFGHFVRASPRLFLISYTSKVLHFGELAEIYRM